MTDFYSQRIDRFRSILSALTHRSKLIGRSRLLTFLISVAWVIMLWQHTIAMSSGLILLIFLFISLVRKSKQVDQNVTLHQHLLLINEGELAALSGLVEDRPTGESYISGSRSQDDLDLFGPGSLFQTINRSISEQGADRLALIFNTLYDKENILAHQSAFKELSTKYDWRQLLMAVQMAHPIRQGTQSTLTDWIKLPFPNASLGVKKILALVLPLVTTGMTLFFAVGLITINSFTLFVLLSFLGMGLVAYRSHTWFKHLHRISKELNTLLPCIEAIEKESFTSPLLQEMVLKVKSPYAASASIKKLNLILERNDYRLNPIVHIPLNFFSWWDLQNWIALISWRNTFQGDIHIWFEVLGEIEAFNSLANLGFNHPDWAYPEISADWFVIQARGLAHPLLSKSKAVVNDFEMRSPNHMDLITGSNMAGKSTFLRALGTNMILAGIGSPVHAAAFIISPGKVMTSMRISDNLQEETSTFYAELKKIKAILDAVQSGVKVIILIDEMLRGTNTEDRKQGSRSLVTQLIEAGAVGIIASHDTSLSTLEGQYPEQVKNYYFDSFIDGDQLKFDYKLKEGICTSANATYLMKQMGIHI